MPKRCAHDIVNKMEAIVTMEQWIHAVRDNTGFVLVAAKLTNPFTLDATTDFSGVLSASAGRTRSEGVMISGVELFSGGFSGWTQTMNALSKCDIPTTIRLAVDNSRPCVETYAKTFDAVDVGGPWQFARFEDELPSKMVAEADVRCFKWLHLIGNEEVDALLASPPCPPWSRANHGPGLSNDLGALMLDTVGLVKLIKPKTFALENVGGLMHHAHFRYIKDFIRFAGYHIRWCHNANLRDILPQNRERLLLIAVKVGEDSLQPHICVEWPLRMTPSMYSAKIIMKRGQIPAQWKVDAELSEQTLDLYLKDNLLPHGPEGIQVGGPWKKPRNDVWAYRIRHPQDAFACIMAAYSHGHQLPQRNLEFSGLFGTLLMDDGHLRFLVLPEIVCLMGATQDVWLGPDVKQNFHMLGNAIAIPHAAICAANLVATLQEGYDSHAVKDLFNKIIDQRICADDMVIHEMSNGWLFSRQKDSIPPTIPLHDFVLVHLYFESDEIVLHCERELDLWGVLHILMSDTKPASMFLKPLGHPNKCIPVPKPFLLLSDVHHVTLISKPVLRLHPQVHRSAEVLVTPTVVVIAERQVFALHLGRLKTVQAVAEVIMDAIDIEGLIPTNQFGRPLDPLQFPPYHFILMPTCVKPMDFSAFQLVTVTSVAQIFTFASAPHVIEEIIHSLRNSGILQMIKPFGWCFASTVPQTEDEHDLQVTLMRIPGVLSIETSDLRNCLLCFLFLAELANFELMGPSPRIEVHLKLLGYDVWHGFMNRFSKCESFDQIWNKVAGVLHIHAQLRYIVAGRQVNPEMHLCDYMTDEMTAQNEIRIHTLLELRGGGPSIRLTPNDSSEVEGQFGNDSHMTADVFHLDRFFFTDAMNMVVNDWLALPSQRTDVQTTRFLAMQISQEDGMIIWKADLETLFRFVKALKEVGAELILGKLGWVLSIHFIAWEEVTLGRILLFPRPIGRSVSETLVRGFLQVVMLRFAFVPQNVPEEQAVRIKIKSYGAVIHQF